MFSKFFPMQEQALLSQNRMKFLMCETETLLGKFCLEFEKAESAKQHTGNDISEAGVKHSLQRRMKKLKIMLKS